MFAHYSTIRPSVWFEKALRASSAHCAHQQPNTVFNLSTLIRSTAQLHPTAAKKREMEDNTKKIGQLFWRLNQRDVSESVVPKLIQLCQAMDAADWHSANHIQARMHGLHGVETACMCMQRVVLLCSQTLPVPCLPLLSLAQCSHHRTLPCPAPLTPLECVLSCSHMRNPAPAHHVQPVLTCLAHINYFAPVCPYRSR